MSSFIRKYFVFYIGFAANMCTLKSYAPMDDKTQANETEYEACN